MAENTETIQTETIQDAETAVEATAVETAAEVIETASTEDTAETTEAVGEAVETSATGGEEGETAEGEEGAETSVEAGGEPIVLSETDELPVVVEKVGQLKEKYELPEEIVKVIDVLQAKAESNTIPDLADYGDINTVKTVLEHHNNIHSIRAVEDENGQQSFRPNTDIYVKELTATSPEKAAWLTLDLLSQESQKYPGLTKLQEINADTLAVEGDTTETFLQRFRAWQQHLLEGATVPDSDIPAYIPVELRPAFKQLAKESREELMFLDPKDDELRDEFGDLLYPANKSTRERKLTELARQQAGIDAELREQQAKQDAKLAEAQKLVEEATNTQIKFYTETRRNNLERLKKELNLSPLEAAQRLTLLELAFDPSDGGNFARSALEAEGIKFDTVRAGSLVKAIEQASIEWTEANRFKDKDGKPINPVQVNKAARALEAAGREWRAFADDIIKQQNKHAEKTEEAKEQSRNAKIKVQPKARSVVKTSAAASAKPKGNPHPYGTREYDKFWADQQLAEESAKARAYAN